MASKHLLQEIHFARFKFPSCKWLIKSLSHNKDLERAKYSIEVLFKISVITLKSRLPPTKIIGILIYLASSSA